jgi:hypothetical protein
VITLRKKEAKNNIIILQKKKKKNVCLQITNHVVIEDVSVLGIVPLILLSISNLFFKVNDRQSGIQIKIDNKKK